MSLELLFFGQSIRKHTRPPHLAERTFRVNIGAARLLPVSLPFSGRYGMDRQR